MKRLFYLLICFYASVVYATKVEVYLNDPLRFSSPQQETSSDIGLALINLINQASQSIDFAIYGIRNQDEVVQALRRAKKRGVKIRGIVDKTISDTNYYESTDSLINEFGNIKSDYTSDMHHNCSKTVEFPNQRCTRPMGFQGPLQCVGYSLSENTCIVAGHASKEPLIYDGYIMHNKFFIIDHQIVWTGSTNISDSGTGGYNANIAVVLDEPNIVKGYIDEFNEMYENENFHDCKNHLKNKSIQGEKIQLSFSPQGQSMKMVRKLVQEAKDYIDVPIFFLTHIGFSGDLIKAHQRGVKVRIIIDATAAVNGYTKHELLRAAGIPVKVENWGGKMHAKVVVIDGRYLVTGSMNFTSAGVYQNDENTLIIDDFNIARKVHHYFNHLWDSIPEKWLYNNPVAESLQSGTSCFDGVDNNFNHLIDHHDQNCLTDLPIQEPLPPYSIIPKSEGYGLIKGVITSQGKKRYIFPGASEYHHTVVHPERGETYFCSKYDLESSNWWRKR